MKLCIKGYSDVIWGLNDKKKPKISISWKNSSFSTLCVSFLWPAQFHVNQIKSNQISLFLSHLSDQLSGLSWLIHFYDNLQFGDISKLLRVHYNKKSKPIHKRAHTILIYGHELKESKIFVRNKGPVVTIYMSKVISLKT